MTTLVTNIARLLGVRDDSCLLLGKDLAILPSIENAFLVIEDGELGEFGNMKSIPVSLERINNRIDASGQFVLPAWCDSHTHLVFATSREQEFVDRIRGLTYAEIAARGGGILQSARKLNDLSEDQLFNSAWQRLQQISQLGTGAVEIKSGYGLSLEGELKMLRVIQKLKATSNLLIKSTFLGAHAYPAEYSDNHQGYVDQIITQMLPAIASQNLADYVDVFCEAGFFSAADTERICREGLRYGLKPKIHANQLSLSGGVEVGVTLGAVSVDHLEKMTAHQIEMLSRSQTIATLLPTAAFFLGMPFPPARELIDAGCGVALASDYNPGSSPSGNMNLVISMACMQMKMLPEEAINAATLNGAHAMNIDTVAGSITPGKTANLIFTKAIPSVAYLPYSFGENLIDRVMIKGDFI